MEKPDKNQKNDHGVERVGAGSFRLPSVSQHKTYERDDAKSTVVLSEFTDSQTTAIDKFLKQYPGKRQSRKASIHLMKELPKETRNQL